MCQDCGCGDAGLVPVEVHERILAANDRDAAHNRAHFEEHGVLAINLMGSPGAGKTALLEALARARPRLRIGAVSGDLATDHDARRLEAAGIRAGSITTGTACHLDARMVHHALHHVPLAGLDLFFVENVGNLVCPAIYDLGQAINVVALSVTEGEDKPLKYPVMFQAAQAVVITKCDLLPHLRLDLARLREALGRVMPAPVILETDAATPGGVEPFARWLDQRAGALRLRTTA